MTKNNPKPRKPENDLSHLVKGALAVWLNGKGHSLSINFIGCDSNVVDVIPTKREDGYINLAVTEYKLIGEKGKKEKMDTGDNETITIRDNYPSLSELQDAIQKKVSSQLAYSPDDEPVDPLGDKYKCNASSIHSAVVKIIKNHFDVVESN